MAFDQPAQPINFSASPTEIQFLLLPETDSLFSDRALRLKQLAHGHAMGDFLGFASEIAMAQHKALASLPPVSLPPAQVEQAPLAVGSFQLDPAWQQAFRQIVDEVVAKAPGEYATRVKGLLSSASVIDVENWAHAYLAGDAEYHDIGIMPLVAAGLQVYWAALTRQLDGRAIKAHPAGQPAHYCPVCNALPVGSIVRAGAANQGLRYLTCSLCASQWNMERIHCVNCGDSQHVFYYGIEGSDGAVQAETCDSCHVYTKLVHMEKNPAVDIVADDLATVALDILVGDAGYERYGMNPLLIMEMDGYQRQ